MSPESTAPSRNRKLYVGSAISLAVAAVICLAGFFLEHHAEPIARARIIASLQAEFNCPVELDEVSVSVLHGLQVDGRGLRITNIGGHARIKPGGPPMLTAQNFQFATTFRDLIFRHESLITVYAQGLTISIPAANDRKPFAQTDLLSSGKPYQSLFLNRVIATHSTLVLESADPAKPSTTFDFAKAILFDPGKDKPFAYETILTIPEPRGEIHSVGHIGPWNEDDPAQTPVDGNFTFDHVDLTTVEALHGTLTASGTLTGILGQIAVHGTTDTPDFALDISAHPFPLHAEYQALVDGITSSVALQAVSARFLHTSVEASGLITHTKGTPGHNITLDFNMRNGRGEDILTVVSDNKPPALSSAVSAEGHLEVPPGPQKLVKRMNAHGNVSLTETTWSIPAIQQQVNALSLRAQDVHKAKQAIDHPESAPPVSSSTTADFKIHDGNIEVTNLLYKMPGATALMTGHYPLAGKELEFHGIARTIASAAQLESGIKSVLTKPISPFLHKNDAGMQLPISFSGDKTHPDFHLDLTHPNVDKEGAPPPPAALPGPPS